MIIGCPKETKEGEGRVGLNPKAAGAFVAAGHEVLVEKGAGWGSGSPDSLYAEAGATIVSKAKEVWAKAELLIKVKEPLAAEYPLMGEGQIIFAFLHLAANRELTMACLDQKVTAVAFESVTVNGGFPLLAPMSAIAGRSAILVGAYFLGSQFGGSGILSVGPKGTNNASALIIGAGEVGRNAALVALGLGVGVTVLDVNPQKLKALESTLPSGIRLLLNDPATLNEELSKADIVVGAVLSPGGKAPIVVSRKSMRLVKPGSVVVDVAIDQGGCFETSRPTTLSQPTYVEEGVVHYCVGNMPGAYPKTATEALSEVVLPYGLALANLGLVNAIKADPALLTGLNAYNGFLTSKPVALDFGLLDRFSENLLF
jgi:alanine dehydrogenase